MMRTFDYITRLLWKNMNLLCYVSISGVFLAALFFSSTAIATPSTTFWAPSTPYIQPYKVLHVTYDTYYARSAAYGITTGLTMGVLPGEKFQAEAGYDSVYPGNFPLSFNGKVGSPEGALYDGSPGWSFGIFGLGTQKDTSDFNILHLMLGKTLSTGIWQIGGYYGLNENLMKSSAGEVQKAGLMAGWFSPAIDVPYIDKIMLTADVMTGNNSLGAWGGGVYFYITPAIDVLVGPVFFFDKALQPGGSSWLWTMQVDVDIDMK